MAGISLKAECICFQFDKLIASTSVTYASETKKQKGHFLFGRQVAYDDPRNSSSETTNRRRMWAGLPVGSGSYKTWSTTAANPVKFQAASISLCSRPKDEKIPTTFIMAIANLHKLLLPLLVALVIMAVAINADYGEGKPEGGDLAAMADAIKYLQGLDKVYGQAARPRFDSIRQIVVLLFLNIILFDLIDFHQVRYAAWPLCTAFCECGFSFSVGGHCTPTVFE